LATTGNINKFTACKVEGCTRNAHWRSHGALGWCKSHYARWRAHGDPLGGRTPLGEPMRWLQSVVRNPPEGCVIWPFATSRGYGYIRKFRNEKSVSASRAALILHTNQDPQDADAAHGPCHNRLCCNPKHLSWKSRADNMADKARDGTNAIGEKNPQSKLTAADILEIRKMRSVRHISQQKIADQFCVSRKAIGKILSGETWSHV